MKVRWNNAKKLTTKLFSETWWKLVYGKLEYSIHMAAPKPSCHPLINPPFDKILNRL
jgi:hypothetical protein